MEKFQLERREKIAGAILLAFVGSKLALEIRKDGRLGHARDYPSGSFIIEVLKGAKEKSIRISGVIERLKPLKIKIDPAEHFDDDLDETIEVFGDEVPEIKEFLHDDTLHSPSSSL